MAKNACRRVPQLCRGVCCFFDVVEKTTHPTRMRNVRKLVPSRTHKVIPIEGGHPGSHVETFSVARTPLGIVAVVCNRGISPSLRFFCGKTRPAAARWKHLLAGDPAAPSRCDGISRPLCKAVDEKVYTCEGHTGEREGTQFPRNPTRMGWHAPACMFCPFASGTCSGVNPTEG